MAPLVLLPAPVVLFLKPRRIASITIPALPVRRDYMEVEFD
jgi:hypothetical protein